VFLAIAASFVRFQPFLDCSTENAVRSFVIMQNSSFTAVPFELGQVWKMDDSRLEIGLVGRTLVHYRHFKEPTFRSPTQLSAKAALEKFLKKHNAILVKDVASCPPAGVLRFMRRSPRSGAPTTSN
jgi:hypothetical protein